LSRILKEHEYGVDISINPLLGLSCKTLSENPYEFKVLEEVLNTIYKNYVRRLNLFIPVVNCVLDTLASRTDEEALMKLLPMSRSLNDFNFSVQEFRSAIVSILKNDNDLKAMCLTSKTEKNRKEIELLLEYYSKQTEEMENEIRELQHNIDSTRQVIDLSLDSARNNLMILNINIALVTLAFAAGGFIGSMFGMNLESGLEHHPTMFLIMSSAMVSMGLLITSLYSFYYFYKKRRIVKTSSFAMNNNFFDNVNNIIYTNKIRNIDTKEDFRDILEVAVGKPISLIESTTYFDTYRDSKKQIFK